MSDRELVSRLMALPVWGEPTGFRVAKVYDSIDSFLDTEQSSGLGLDLFIIGTELVSEASMKSLQRIRDRSGGRIVFCGGEGDFETARLGILLGIVDYITASFESGCLLSVFKRISGSSDADLRSVEEHVTRLTAMFIKREDELYELMEQLSGFSALSSVIDRTVRNVFESLDWLDLYLNEEDFLSEKQPDLCEQKRMFLMLFESRVQLDPPHSSALDKVIQYIIYAPESDLRQKNLSEELHINRSYLSTVFTAQTGSHFVDYVTRVKLMRAAWLLRNTNMKISEIAGRMDYKDIAYFSRQFKKVFKITPSGYRIPDDYDFNI
ncbi:MAG: helix-turn-helix domain-containing protein [Ruminococcus sp.]|nr:helix-turn-helix domain-containing protein [Ruminococcus sp.]